MVFNLDGQIDKANMILGVISVKQQALSSNIANVNTPGYVRQDISFEQYLGDIQCPVETALSKKMGGSPVSEEVGGRVNITNELMAMQKNALFYSMAIRHANSLIQELRTAAQVGK